MKLLLFSLVVTIFTQFISGQMLIPKREVGFVYKDGHPCASIKLSTFIDLTCPDSQEAYPTMLKVADALGPSKLQLKVHLFSLPYHRHSHTLSKAAHVLDQFQSSKNVTVFDWFKLVYENIDSLTTSATVNKSDAEILNFLASLANDLTGISTDAFKSEVYNTDIDQNTRLAWKYGCTRGVYGTPMFTVNDVFVEADASWSVDQWINLLKQLLTKGSHNRCQ